MSGLAEEVSDLRTLVQALRDGVAAPDDVANLLDDFQSVISKIYDEVCLLDGEIKEIQERDGSVRNPRAGGAAQEAAVREHGDGWGF